MSTFYKTAFTLIELLVVIAIIGILSGLIIVTLGGMTDKANIAKAQVFSNSLRNGLLGNLVSEWNFNNTIGTVDSVLTNGTVISDSWTGSYPGTTVNGPTLKGGTDCIYDKCLSFDGSNDYVAIGNVNLNITNQMTVGLWVKFIGLDYTGSTGVLNTFLGKGYPDTAPGTPSSGFWFSYDNRGNGKGFNYTCFGNSAGGYSGGGNNFPYNYTFSNNVWYYLSFTVDSSSNAKLYINASQLGATRVFTNLVLTNNTNILNIGSSSMIGSYFKGLLDDVRIYNTAMPISQIKEQYYAGLNNLLINGSITKEEYISRIDSYGKY